jgi:hypothetical protein
MTASSSHRDVLRHALWADAASHLDGDLLRTIVVAAGLSWSAVFVAIGLRYELQLFGDGSIFSYSIAVEDAWAVHWHNISGRLFTYFFSILPAETYVELTKDAHGAIFLYGVLHFAAPLLGLLATWAADRSKDRTIFVYACLSTAVLAPLVFGFPTEMWIAHAIFWPALAISHYRSSGIGGFALVFTVLLALAFTHEGALVFVAAILTTLAIRRIGNARSLKCIGALSIVMPIWLFVKLTFPPDSYYAPVFVRSALHFFDATIFETDLVLLVFGALTTYLLAFILLWRRAHSKAWLYASLIVTIELAVYWLWFDQGLHATNRYYMRTALVIVAPVLGVLAVARRSEAEQWRLPFKVPRLMGFINADKGRGPIQAVFGMFCVITLVYVVETIRFVVAWNDYKTVVRALAMGTESDPNLGDLRFVSSTRIDASLERLSWNSTTPYLSVLLAPGFAPARLVVDPASNYFWFSCETAKENLDADRAVSKESRELVRVYACLHRYQ